MSKEPTVGPYKSTTTKVIKLSNLEFSVTETVDATHVPPAPCSCGDSGLGAMGILEMLRNAYTAAQSAPTPPSEGGDSDQAA